jgi:hexaprenyl-diphosphate synthase
MADEGRSNRSLRRKKTITCSPSTRKRALSFILRSPMFNSTRRSLFLSSLPRRGHRTLQGLAAQPARKHNPSTLTPADLIPNPAPRSRVDPFDLISPELSHLRASLLTLLGSTHPGLTSIAEYYFLQPSKQLRPLLVLLFARATNGLGAGWRRKNWAANCQGARGMAAELDAPLTRPDVLNDWNPNIPEHTASFQTTFNLVPVPPSPSSLPPPPATNAAFEPCVVGQILPTQVRLAQIAEMIHVASLLHDDVIDDSPLRRGAPSSPAHFGNKLTILGGDFLLGRASAALSRLGEPEVVELVASVIANLVEGEVMQAREVHSPESLPDLNMRDGDGGRVSQYRWNIYLKKTYLKTASLMAKTVRSSVILGGCTEGEVWKEVAYAYGRNIGIAFQVRVPGPPHLVSLIQQCAGIVLPGMPRLGIEHSRLTA